MLDADAPFVTRAPDGAAECLSLRLGADAGRIEITLTANGVLAILRPRPVLMVRDDGRLDLDCGMAERVTFPTSASLPDLAALEPSAQREALFSLTAAAIAARPASAKGGAEAAIALLRDLLTAHHPGGTLTAAVRGRGTALRLEAPGAPPAALAAARRLLRGLRYDAGQSLSCAPRAQATMLADVVDAERFFDLPEPSGHERMAANARLQAWATTAIRRRWLAGAI